MRIRYPKVRKTPYRHKVREHVRSSPKGKVVKVREYERGKGEPRKKVNVFTKVKKFTKSSPRGFFLIINYPDGKESFEVKASSYLDAVSNGLIMRKRVDMPLSVRVKVM